MKEGKHCRKKINGLSWSLISRKVPLKESNNNVFIYTYMHSLPIKISSCLKGKSWVVLAPWVIRRQKQTYSKLMDWFCHLHCPLSLPAVGFQGIFSIIYSNNSLSSSTQQKGDIYNWIAVSIGPCGAELCSQFIIYSSNNRAHCFPFWLLSCPSKEAMPGRFQQGPSNTNGSPPPSHQVDLTFRQGK